MAADGIQHGVVAVAGSSAGAAPVEVETERTPRWIARLYGGISGAVGTIAGITPHVLHHVGPIAGAALVTGTRGSLLFGGIGFVLTVPLLLQLKRRFGSWLAPGIALAVFGAMFTISTLWIGPAISDAVGDDDKQAPLSDPHHTGAHPASSPDGSRRQLVRELWRAAGPKWEAATVQFAGSRGRSGVAPAPARRV